jgi:phage major head subunit gpT-like protein
MSRAIVLTVALVQSVFTGFKAAFQKGFASHTPVWQRIATKVPSNTKEEKYGWLGKLASMREWIGDREFRSLTTSDYTIKNRKFEGSYELDRDDIADDAVGLFSPFLEDLGLTGAELPDRLVFEGLQAGRTEKCFDGQYFFDTDHPSFNEKGEVTSWSNYQAGTGEPWYLMVTRRPLKPLIYQEREPVELQVLTDIKSEHVVKTDKFLYGNRGRMNVGYGFPQMVFCSRADLTAANYEAAYKAIQKQFGEGGRSLNLTPDLLVIGSDNRGAAKRLIERATVDGSDNEYYKDVEILTSPLVVA